ncbi:hypothetical protein ATEIFO6365_0007032300 [Aspergillus terreus]|uniref:Uncharacterized protein n=1 Tax=Aspergillus terreus TaxID=33178 RepID=A0A5M3Z5W1_ASPTE|nr:hypothetical protein ATETN484_0009032300 [Aspergillus terreus]GFF17774.1 hypothetical protein ATEIFO6365_0007032300 [Aspergillus terreus]
MRTLSPDGDIYIIFRPDTPSNSSEAPNGSQQSETPSLSTSADNISTNSDHTDPTALRVSSSILSCKCPVFNRMLNGHYKEAVTLAVQHTVTINLAEDNPDAAFHLLNLLHDQPFTPPAELTLETLAHIASLVEKYLLHRAVRDSPLPRWLDAFTAGPRYRAMKNQPDVYMSDIMLWMATARALRCTEQSKAWKRIAIREAGTRVDLSGFPLARSVQDDIQRKRFNAITLVQSFLQAEIDACRPQRGQDEYAAPVVPRGPYERALWDSLVFGHLNTIGTQWGLLPCSETQAREFPGVRLRDLARNTMGMVDLDKLMVADKGIATEWRFDSRSLMSTLGAFVMIFAGFVPRRGFMPKNSVHRPDDLKTRLVQLLRGIDEELDLEIPELNACSRWGTRSREELSSSGSI